MLKSVKKLFIILLAASLLASVPVSSPLLRKVEAASAASKNRAAKKAYKKIRKKLLKKSTGLSYKLCDLTGDGVYEMFVQYDPKTGGPSLQAVYTFRSGKAKKALGTRIYGLDKIYVYKKSKSLILRGRGHGGEQYVYFKMSGRKYKRAASRARQAIAGGHWENGPWYYYSGSDRAISRSGFRSRIKGIKSGSCKTLKPLKWTYYG